MFAKNIIQWFNPKDHKHIEAYRHLQHTGLWPEGFLPKDIEFGPHWQIELKSILADLYIDRMLEGKIFGDDGHPW